MSKAKEAVKKKAVKKKEEEGGEDDWGNEIDLEQQAKD